MATIVFPQLNPDEGSGDNGTVYLMGGDTYNDHGMYWY